MYCIAYCEQILQRRQGMISGGLTIKELNDLLDQLASSENRYTISLSVFSHNLFKMLVFRVNVLLFQ